MRVHPNRHRGEIAARLDGENRILCLTLGALAELESAFGVDNLAGLAERFEHGRLSAGDIIRIVGAGLRGAGNIASDEDVAQMSAEGGVAGFAAIATELLWATFGGDGEGQANRPAAKSANTDRQDSSNPGGTQAASR
ncbi:MAG: gene transfer agent family protein [Hoeflea sp.]|uniref:gene transfer agent family protein n=1 Tax=Hoeflea sp. TaxID=1940281 RepID=UPI0032ED4D79